MTLMCLHEYQTYIYNNNLKYTIINNTHKQQYNIHNTSVAILAQGPGFSRQGQRTLAVTRIFAAAARGSETKNNRYMHVNYNVLFLILMFLLFGFRVFFVAVIVFGFLLLFVMFVV